MSCGVGCRRGSDPELLWLWRRPVATAPIQPLAWELTNAVGVALKRPKKKKKKEQTFILSQLQQHWILHPLSEARDQTHVLMDNSGVCYHRATMGTPV